MEAVVETEDGIFRGKVEALSWKYESAPSYREGERVGGVRCTIFLAFESGLTVTGEFGAKASQKEVEWDGCLNPFTVETSVRRKFNESWDFYLLGGTDRVVRFEDIFQVSPSTRKTFEQFTQIYLQLKSKSSVGINTVESIQ